MACSAFMMLSFDSAAACKIPSGLAGPAAALSRLDVTVGMIFFLIPVVLTKLLMMWFYWTLWIKATMVFAQFARERKDDEQEHVTSRDQGNYPTFLWKTRREEEPKHK